MQEKLFYKIGEASRITGLKPYVLRFWETEFPSLHPKKNSGGQRAYTKKEIDQILEIKRLLYKEGCTIPGAKKKLGMQRPLRDLPKGTVEAIKKELEDLLTLLS